MYKYIGKRLIASLITIFAVITVTFFLMRFMLGNPYNSDKLTAQARTNIEQKYGLDKSLMEQYTMYIKNLTNGDLGESMNYANRNVTDTIIKSFPISANIGLLSILIALIGGIILGIIATLKGGIIDSLIVNITTLFTSIPSFVVSAVLIYVLAVKLYLLPATGFDDWKSYIMPCTSLAITPLAYITRLIRSNLMNELQMDYIKVLQAKGLSKEKIIYKHALKNSVIPIITYIGQLIPNILTGSFVIEKIFGIGGLGSEFVQSVSNRDYITLLGVTAFYCVLLIGFTFIADMIYMIIDPRIKLQEKNI